MSVCSRINEIGKHAYLHGQQSIDTHNATAHLILQLIVDSIKSCKQISFVAW